MLHWLCILSLQSGSSRRVLTTHNVSNIINLDFRFIINDWISTNNVLILVLVSHFNKVFLESISHHFHGGSVCSVVSEDRIGIVLLLIVALCISRHFGRDHLHHFLMWLSLNDLIGC